MFDEAIASELPIVALEPPPGAERLQHELLDKWDVGRAVWSIEELTQTVSELLNNPSQLVEMRKNARNRKPQNAARHVAEWLSAAGGRNFSAKGDAVVAKAAAGGLMSDVSTG
jgi:UDP-N-acetylglucosamine:LPS N-acetylglucosamine transferase